MTYFVLIYKIGHFLLFTFVTHFVLCLHTFGYSLSDAYASLVVQLNCVCLTNKYVCMYVCIIIIIILLIIIVIILLLLLLLLSLRSLVDNCI